MLNKNSVNNVFFEFENEKSLFISPHPDDIAFSISGLLLSKMFKGATLLTIFTGSNYAPNLATTEIAKISHVRKDEDRSFCERFELQYAYLDLKDSLARGISKELTTTLNSFDEPTFSN